MAVRPASPDIFEILDIVEREDTYSRLLVYLLRRSPGLRQHLLAHAFGADAPLADPATVDLRRHARSCGGARGQQILPQPCVRRGARP